MRCARVVRKVGHSPPPVGSFLGLGWPQGTIAIVYPCSINPPPSCVYVPLQTGTLRPVYGDTFSGCRPRGIIFCSHFSDPLLHAPWTMDTRSNGVRVPATVVGFAPDGFVHLEYFRDAVKVVNRQCKVKSISFAIPGADSPPLHFPCLVTHFSDAMPIGSIGGALCDVLFNPKYAGCV